MFFDKPLTHYKTKSSSGPARKSKFNKIPKQIKKDFQISQNLDISPEDEDFIYRVLIQLLKYPDLKLAQLHRTANVLGKKDLKIQKQVEGQKKYKQKFNIDDSQVHLKFTQGDYNDEVPLQVQKSKNSQQFCQCCGFVRQNRNISILQDFQNFPTIGLSTYLFFQTIKNVSIMLGILMFIYGVFAIFVNYYILSSATGYSLIDGLVLIGANYQTVFSYKSIQSNYTTKYDQVTTLTRIGAILIMVVIVLWCLCVYVFKHFQIQHEQMIDDNSKTASDFAVMIQRAPIQDFKDTQFISKQFDKYFKSILPQVQRQYFDKHLKKDKYQNAKLSVVQQLKKLKLNKINIGIPFYFNQNYLQFDKEYDSLLEKLQENKKILIQWVIQFFQNKCLKVKKQQREKLFVNFKDTQQRIKHQKQNFVKTLQTQYKSTNPEQMTTTVFITFQSAIAAKIVYQLNPNDIPSKLRYFLSCCNKQFLLNLKGKNGKPMDLIISRAPQPQDIKWENIGFSFMKIFSRRLLTYFITVAILAGSFWFITYLSEIQLHTGNELISIAISLAIAVLNIGIGQVIYSLTVFEKDFTETNHQASLAIKSIFAQLINSIAIPVVVKQNNIYGQSGLADDVFFLAITTAFLKPFLRVIDFTYFYTRILYWFKSKPKNRLGIDQVELNNYAESMAFQVGFQYIYVANIFLISCFYAPLQPIVPVISLLGLLFMYWVQKYTLLNRTKRPVPGSDVINAAVSQVINLGPIMLGIGALTFSDILSNYGERNLKFLLHIISISLAVFLYLLPFKTIYRAIFTQDQLFDNLNYFQSRLLLPSQYDRMNPATSGQGMKDFMSYLKQINEFIANKNKNNQNQTVNKMAENIALMFQKSKENPYDPKNQFTQMSKAANQNFLPIINMFKDLAKRKQIKSVNIKSEFPLSHMKMQPAPQNLNIDEQDKINLAIQQGKKTLKNQQEKSGKIKNDRTNKVILKRQFIEKISPRNQKIQNQTFDKESLDLENKKVLRTDKISKIKQKSIQIQMRHQNQNNNDELQEIPQINKKQYKMAQNTPKYNFSKIKQTKISELSKSQNNEFSAQRFQSLVKLNKNKQKQKYRYSLPKDKAYSFKPKKQQKQSHSFDVKQYNSQNISQTPTNSIKQNKLFIKPSQIYGFNQNQSSQIISNDELQISQINLKPNSQTKIQPQNQINSAKKGYSIDYQDLRRKRNKKNPYNPKPLKKISNFGSP